MISKLSAVQSRTNGNHTIKCHNYITINLYYTFWSKFESAPSESCLWVFWRIKKVSHLQSATELGQVGLFQTHWSDWEGFALGRIILTLSTPPSFPPSCYQSSLNYTALRVLLIVFSLKTPKCNTTKVLASSPIHKHWSMRSLWDTRLAI